MRKPTWSEETPERDLKQPPDLSGGGSAYVPTTRILSSHLCFLLKLQNKKYKFFEPSVKFTVNYGNLVQACENRREVQRLDEYRVGLHEKKLRILDCGLGAWVVTSVASSDFRKYVTLITQNPDGVCELNLDGEIVECNAAFEKLTGYSRNELSGMHFTKLMFDDEIEDAKRQFQDFNGEAVTGFECKVRHKTGKSIYTSSNALPIVLDQEWVGLFAIVKDMTSQKLYEESFQKIQNMLAYSQSMASVGSWELYPAKQISSWSDEMFNIYGMEKTQYVYFSKFTEQIHPDDKERYLESFKSLSTGGPHDLEFRIIRPDGEIRTLHSKREMLVDNNEIRIIGTTQDITEQKCTQTLLFKAEKLSAIGQMAAGLAHEIRNPLTALKGFLKLIPTVGNPDRYIDIMNNELNRIETVTNELLVLAKPQAKRFRLMNVVEKLTDVLQLLTTHALMKSIEVCMEAQPNVSWIEGDSGQLEQVFVNLIKNAIEATHVGGQVSIQIADHDNQEVILQVVDNGSGIPEEDLPKLFEPFYTTKENGTGLGLMISQKIIVEHHGTLEIHSKAGEGTRVIVTLPCRQLST